MVGVHRTLDSADQRTLGCFVLISLCQVYRTVYLYFHRTFLYDVPRTDVIQHEGFLCSLLPPIGRAQGEELTALGIPGCSCDV